MANPKQVLARAARLAYTIDGNKDYLFGCLAFRDDGTEVRSRNQRVRGPHPQAHAEARVLRKAGMNAILYVARVTRDKKWGLAQPCKTCQTLIRNRRVKRVFYTIGPNEFGVWDP